MGDTMGTPPFKPEKNLFFQDKNSADDYGYAEFYPEKKKLKTLKVAYP